MQEYFRVLAVHHAKVHKAFVEGWQGTVPADKLDAVVDGLVYDGIWLTKFPLLASPRFGIQRLAALDKARPWAGDADRTALGTEAAALVGLVDADVLRFVLGLKPGVLEQKVEIFFGGRAMNKPLWNYLLAWFDHDSILRTRWGTAPGLLDTVFS